MNEHKPRIFLCHAKEDKPRVIELYHQLKKAGYHPWLDEEDLLPGADWRLEIGRAIRSSKLFLACLSKASIDKQGYVQKEIKIALDVLDEMPEGKIYLIPVRLEECGVPDRLESRHWVDLFEPGGFEKLKRALDYELGPRALAPIEPELIHIPAGEFLMGSNPKKDKYASEDDQPQHTVHLPEYYIAKTPVTNAQYLAFVQGAGHTAPKRWGGGRPPKGKEDHPVVSVSWHDAIAYCNCLAEATGKAYRLASEAEWEKVARGKDGRIYPWGDELPDKNRCNFGDRWLGDTTPVGHYSPQGDGPYGCVDMSGNVWEWTSSLFKGYPYDPEDGREDREASGVRVLRGGAFDNSVRDVRCASCLGFIPDDRSFRFGFGIVLAPGLL